LTHIIRAINALEIPLDAAHVLTPSCSLMSDGQGESFPIAVTLSPSRRG